MTPAPQNSSLPCNLDRFQAAQAEQVASILHRLQDRFRSLNAEDLQMFNTIWSLIAQATAPVAISATSSRHEAGVQRALRNLSMAAFIWYDTDLQCVLQCPPFSALTTPHHLKAFGWDSTHACSLIDAPLALLLYGPNTWMTVQSLCHRSGELLEFQIMMDDSLRLKTHSPYESGDWRIWVPAASGSANGTDQEQHAATSFYSLADYETSHDYQPENAGLVYSFPEAMAFSECLLQIYHRALRSG